MCGVIRHVLRRVALACAALAAAGCTTVLPTDFAISSGERDRSGPAPVLLWTEGPGFETWGTATPLADGTLVTAAHVLERGFPVRIGQRQLEGIDIIRRGRTRGSRTDALGDWVLFRAAPFEGRGWAAATDAHAPHAGQHAVLRGFVRSKDASGQLTPLLVEIPVRFRNRPWWMSGEELDSFRFVDPLDGAARLDLSGMSGGPVLVEDGSGREWLVGILVQGQALGALGMSGGPIWLVQPWPPR